MDILRFTTAGSIDDGKSTLTGRLLYNTGNIKNDILESVKKVNDTINLAHITDGLRSEREGGITIDIGYKYFKTAKRKYIISDAPGHFQYTKNMVTGASNVDVMIILIDARHGITSQTRVHSLVASFLKVKHVVIAINKMDMLNYSEEIFNTIRTEYLPIAQKLNLENVQFIPLSALHGDNVSTSSANMPWYKGNDLLTFLENCPAQTKSGLDAFRFAVQHTAQDNGNTFCYGKLLSGSLRKNEAIKIYPSGEVASIKNIIHGYEETDEIDINDNICLQLNESLTIKRGDIIAPETNAPSCSNDFQAYICWLDDAVLDTGKAYLLRLNTQETICYLTNVLYKTDTFSFVENTDEEPLKVNEFAMVSVKTTDNIAYDSFDTLPENARGIIIDRETNNTVAAFTIN